jgi:hypothetical protein
MNRRPKRVVVSAAILIPEYEALEAYARTQGTTTSSAIRECLRAAGVFETASREVRVA